MAITLTRKFILIILACSQFYRFEEFMKESEIDENMKNFIENNDLS